MKKNQIIDIQIIILSKIKANKVLDYEHIFFVKFIEIYKKKINFKIENFYK